MVLNEIYFRKTESGPHRLLQPGRSRRAVDDKGNRTGAMLQRGRPAGRVRRHRHDVEVEEQRRRSAGADRGVRRGHRALLHDVHLAAGADAGVVGQPASKARRASCGGCGRSATSSRRARTPAATLAGAALPAELAAARREVHARAEAGELRHGAPPVQHRGLRRHENAERAGSRAEERRGRRAARGRAARRLQHPAAAAVADHAARPPPAVARAGLRRRHPRRAVARARSRRR